MKNLRMVLLTAFFGMYIIGVAIGSVHQVKTDSQAEMYSYLETAVGGYDAEAADSIKSVARDNARLLLLASPGVFFRVGVPGIVAVMLLKGYAAGFAVTAVLRFYGIRGLLLCGVNFISLAILIPALAYYGTAAVGNLIYNRGEKKKLLKKAAVLLLFMLLMLALDSILRGAFSAFFIDMAARAVKPV